MFIYNYIFLMLVKLNPLGTCRQRDDVVAELLEGDGLLGPDAVPCHLSLLVREERTEHVAQEPVRVRV